jgi:Predicted Permease Membrane Region
MPADRKEEIRRHFGDTVKATAEFSYVSLGLGMVLGVLLGLIPIPIPGVGTVTLGIGGGPLIVALIVGKLRRTGPLLWVMPLPANIVLRNFGLAMFLATVGINAGHSVDDDREGDRRAGRRTFGCERRRVTMSYNPGPRHAAARTLSPSLPISSAECWDATFPH